MTIETVKISSIQPDPANLRKHAERNLQTIKGSLARFGQQRPIVVDARGIIIAGNGTYAAAQALGWPSIQIVRTALTGSEAVAFAIADNRTSETSEWDDAALANVLAALKAEDADLAQATGFTLDELAGLIGGNNEPAEPQQPPEEFPEFDEDIQTDHECPKCRYRWSGSTAPQGAA
ncbi:MAG TPA: ParB N-terminal domain-containing protein [Tepidisphaeraceae bacterium]